MWAVGHALAEGGTPLKEIKKKKVQLMSKVRHYTPEHHLLSCKDWRCFVEVIRATTLFFHYLLKQLLLFSYGFF